MRSDSRNALRTSLGVVLVLCCASGVSAAMKKFHQVVVDHAGNTVAEYTTIQDVVPASNHYPYSERNLYKDDGGRLVVIRRSLPTSTTSATKYTCLATSETVELDFVLEDTITVKFGSRSLLIRLADIDRNATALPQGIATQVATALQALSSTCRSALHRLVEIGTYYSLELNEDAGEVGGLLFPDIPHVNPSGDDLIVPRQGIVNPFEPNQTPPNAFEQQFGSAYYQ